MRLKKYKNRIKFTQGIKPQVTLVLNNVAEIKMLKEVEEFLQGCRETSIEDYEEYNQAVYLKGNDVKLSAIEQIKSVDEDLYSFDKNCL